MLGCLLCSMLPVPEPDMEATESALESAAGSDSCMRTHNVIKCCMVTRVASRWLLAERCREGAGHAARRQKYKLSTDLVILSVRMVQVG